MPIERSKTDAQGAGAEIAIPGGRAEDTCPVTARTGAAFQLRPNQLYPPFDRPTARRALLGAIDQQEFMIAIMGEDTSLWSVPCGFFPPTSQFASDAGLSMVDGKR